MSKVEQSVTGSIKKETVILIGLICVGVGFLLGLAFSAYRSPIVVGGANQTAAGQAPAAGALSAEQSQQLLKLEQQVQKDPQDVQAWISLGHLYFDSNQHEKAINAYTKSLAINPNNADVLTDLGVMYRSAGDPDKAIASFDRAIAINSKHETARFNKGVVLLYDRKDQAGAMKAWQELVAINPMATAPNGQLVTDILKEMATAK